MHTPQSNDFRIPTTLLLKVFILKKCAVYTLKSQARGQFYMCDYIAAFFKA